MITQTRVQVATDQDALERRRERLRAKGEEDQDGHEDRFPAASPLTQEISSPEPETNNITRYKTAVSPTYSKETKAESPKAGQAGEIAGQATAESGAVGRKSPAAGKEKKKPPSVKKSKAQQVGWSLG